MKIQEKINELFSGITDYIESEKEIIKLKLVRKVARLMGMVFSTVFIIILFHVCIAIIGIWLGFWLSDIYESFTTGFGITALIYVVWLALSIIFRQTLLVKPFTSAVVSAMVEEEKIENSHE